MKRYQSPTTLLAGLVLAVGLFGCSKKDPEKTGEAGEAEKAAAAAPAAKAFEAPASIVGYGGTADIKQSLAALHGLAGKVTADVPPAAQLEQMITAGIQGEFRLKSAAALDLSKPIRFAFADPKAFGRDPSALMVGITGKDALVAALPELERKEGDQGNAWSYLKFQGSKAPVFVNLVGDHAVFTRHPEVFPKHKDFLEALAGAQMPDHGGAFVEVDHLMAIYGAEFDQGLATAREEMKKAAEATPGGAQQVEMITGMIDWVGAHARQVDDLRVSLATSDAGLKLDLRISPESGTDLAKVFGHLRGTDHPLLAKLPGDALAGFSSATTKEAMVELTRTMGTGLIAPMLADESAAKPYMEAMVELIEATTGTFAGAVIDAPDGNGLTLMGLYGVADAAAARAAQDRLADLNAEPAMVAMYEKTGVKVDVQKNAYQVGGVPVTVQTTSMVNAPPEAMMMMGMMQDLMSQHIAFGEKLGVLGYGSSAKAILERYLGGEAKGGFADKPGVKDALAQAAAKPSMFAYLEPLAIAAKLKLGGMNPLAQMLAGVPTDGGLAFSLGAEGGVLQGVMYVPIKTVQQGMAAFEKNKGKF